MPKSLISTAKSWVANSCSFRRDGILVDQALGFIPRGFYSEGVPGQIEIMAVAQNPGTGAGNDFIETWETRRYEGKSLRAQARITMDLQRRVFRRERLWPSDFQMILQEQLARVLNVAPQEVWKKVVLTQAVKCSTPHNTVAALHVRRICSKTHLIKEIEFWKPRLVVAVGRRAEADLRRLGYDVPWIYHPSPQNRNSPRRVADNERRLSELQRRLGLGGIPDQLSPGTRFARSTPLKEVAQVEPRPMKKPPVAGFHGSLMDYAREFQHRYPTFSIGTGRTQISLRPPGQNVMLAFLGDPPSLLKIDFRQACLPATVPPEFRLATPDGHGFCRLKLRNASIMEAVNCAERVLGFKP